MKLTKMWWAPLIAEIECQKINRLQGSAESRIVVVAPPASEVEVTRNLAFCRHSAEELFILFSAHGIHLNSFLVIPLCFDEVRPTKGSVSLTQRLVALAAQSPLIDGFISIGPDAFKHVFGDGYKPSMQSLAGNFIKHPRLNGKWVFALPDPQGLVMDMTLKRGKAMGIVERWNRTFVQLANKYKQGKP